jgi:hypothetical protein
LREHKLIAGLNLGSRRNAKKKKKKDKRNSGCDVFPRMVGRIAIFCASLLTLVVFMAVQIAI